MPSDAERLADVQYAVSRVLSEARTVDEAVRGLLPAIADALQAKSTALWIVGRDGQSIECVDAWSTGGEPATERARRARGQRFRAGEGLPGRCWTEGQAAASPEGGLAFPVVNVLGVVGVVESSASRHETITPGLLRLTEGIGRQIGQFLLRRAAEERLVENEARYAAIVNAALDAIVAIDEDGRILEFNPAAERLFGYTRADALGQEMATLIIPSGLRDAHRAGLLRHRESGEGRMLARRLELTARRSDGSELPVELTITRIRVQGRWTFVGFARDVTVRQQYKHERDALAARERAAREAAVAANALKEEFLAALSHELRTPLTAILGWSDMLVKGTVDPARFVKVAETIRRNAQAQQRLVEDMLDVSAFMGGRVKLSIERLPLTDPVDRACEVVKPAADARHITLQVAVQPVFVQGDRTRLQQVFWNLLTNAVKFTPAGGSVSTASRVEDRQVAVTVTDSGTGIDPLFLPHVFDRFRQGSDSRPHGGLGLGLAIVKQIVEAHGGTVSAHSEGLGRGAAFTVRLPVDERA